MINNSKRSFQRQMYLQDTEIGKMKLQSVKEGLYEAATKAVQYTIEMYTRQNLNDWVRTESFLSNLDKTNGSLKNARADFEEGYINAIDITNGAVIINNFLRKDVLKETQNYINEKIKDYESQIECIQTLQSDLITQLIELQQKEETLENDSQNDYDSVQVTEEDNENDENINAQKIDELTDKIEEYKSKIDLCNEKINRLKEYQSSGKNLLYKQDDDERNALEELRAFRNENQHRVADEEYISEMGAWEPDGGPLYEWASSILRYLKVINNRYSQYAVFDKFYANKERKDKFDSCKVYVQKLIKELYVNQSDVVFEFAGELFDKEDEEYNFKKLIQTMGKNWDTGIRYLVFSNNDDLPELNNFFKNCLSGTDDYVNIFLVERKQIKDRYQNNNDSLNYAYFKFLYRLNPKMNSIFWKNKEYPSMKKFAENVLYKLLKSQNMWSLKARIKEFDRYTDGIDLISWAENKLLSSMYFAYREDVKGKELAEEFEKNLLDFMNNEKLNEQKYRKCLKSIIYLAFYMFDAHPFFYTGSNGKYIKWNNYDDVKKYLEHDNNFLSYENMDSFIRKLSQNYYFKVWKDIAKEV